MSFKKILVATDFSPGAGSALRTAVRIANASNGELVVAHAWEIAVPSVSETVAPREVFDELHHAAARGLEQVVIEARTAGVKRVESRLSNGSAATEIVDAARELSCDLVVVGTHGRTGFARVLLGSVAEKVVRHASCSVLVVRPDHDPRPFRHVLCPIDFSEGSTAAPRLAAAFAAMDGATLTLLNVVDISFPYVGREAVRYINFLESSSREALATAVAQVRASTPQPVTSRSAIGSAGGQILALLDQDPSIDVVVMGSRGRSALGRFVLGSVSEKVVRHARCPVLVARSGD